MVKPASRDDGDAIESGNTGLCEETCEDVADDSTDGMGGEDLEEEVCKPRDDEDHDQREGH